MLRKLGSPKKKKHESDSSGDDEKTSDMMKSPTSRLGKLKLARKKRTEKQDSGSEESDSKAKRVVSPKSRLSRLRRKKAESGSENEDEIKSPSNLRKKKGENEDEVKNDSGSEHEEELKSSKLKKKKTEAEDSGSEQEIKSPKSRLSRLRKKKAKKPASDSESETGKDRRSRRKAKDESKNQSSEDEKPEEETRKKRRSKKKKQPKPTSDEEPQDDGQRQLSPLRRKPRKPADSSSHSRRDRLVSEKTPEVHVIGEIIGGSEFGSGGFTCKWAVDYGSTWYHISGDQIGQTHVDYPDEASDDVVWSHPLDLHFACDSIQGWPRLQFQIWSVDIHDRSDLAGYGFVHLPCTPGTHQLQVATWRPLGSAKEEVEAFFIGGTTQLTSDDLLFSKAWSDRCRLKTVTSGKIHIELDVLVRNFPNSTIVL